MASLVKGFSTRTHKGENLTRNNPVQITVFNFFVVLILLHIEFFEVVPAVLDGELQTLQYFQYLAVVRARTSARVSERHKYILNMLKFLPCLLSRSVQDDNLEGADESGHIRLAIILRSTVMVNFHLVILGVV